MHDGLPRVRMRQITVQPSLVDQVVEAIVSEIVSGKLPANGRLIQDDLAQAYGVSRQPVQQALLLLRNQGLVKEAQGRGLVVASLDVAFVRNLYEIRAMLDGLAAAKAAEKNPKRARAEGPPIIAFGRSAVAGGSLGDQIAADMRFHALINDLSDNPLIEETTAPHWPYLRRVMAEVLSGDAKMPKAIWDEHAAILDAVMEGDGRRAEALSRAHLTRASKIFVARLQARQDAMDKTSENHRARRMLRPA